SGPMNIAALRKVLGGAQSTVSEIVGRLARLGYIEKRVDPTDSRAVVVTTTARGRRVVRARVEHMKTRHRQLLAALSPADQGRFVQATEVIVSLMSRALLGNGATDADAGAVTSAERARGRAAAARYRRSRMRNGVVDGVAV